MSEIAERDQPLTQSEVVVNFERLARDPQMDVEKLERLMAMQERMMAQQAKQQFAVAMSEAQTEMRPISADAQNPQTRSMYASYAALDKKLRPIYTKHGFALSFDTAPSPVEGCIRVQCYVEHIGGFSRTHQVDMPADGKGAKGGDVMTKTHATGAAMTYGMRYLLKMIFNVAVGEDDNDGNDYERLTDEHYATLDAKIDDVLGKNPSLRTRFLKHMKVSSLDEINDRAYKDAVAAIDSFAKYVKSEGTSS